MKGPAETSIELEVPFHDVDAQRVVWHGHHFKYLELACTALLRDRGLDSSDLEGKRYGLRVIETSCRYSAPLRYRDRVRVDAWLRDVRHRIEMSFEIHNLTLGRRAARARTRLAVIDDDGRLLLEVPRAILDRLVR